MVRAASLALLTMAIAFHSPVNAQVWSEIEPNSGRWLTDVCKSEDNTDRLACFVYIRGVRDGMKLTMHVRDTKPAVCFPSNVDHEMVRRVIVKYGDEHPEDLHHSPSTVAFFAMNRAWPCAD